MTRLNLLALSLLAPALLIGCRRTDPALYSKFEAAQQAFDVAETPDEFQRAAALYQEILDTGIISGAVLYNQGNAYMRAGMRGRALACYRKAQRYRPRDPYLAANLENVLGIGQATSRKRFLDHLLFWQEWISYPGKFQATLVGGLATLLLAAGGVWFRRRGLLRLGLAALCLTAALTVSAAYDWYRFVHVRHGVTVGESIIARKGNAESYEPAFNQPLAVPTEFTVVEERGDWVFVQLASDPSKEGWIPREAAVLY